MEVVTSKWGEFLYALANRQQFALRTQRGFQLGVVVAVPPYPFSDTSAYRRYSEDAVIIFKKVMSSGIHHGDAKLGQRRLAASWQFRLCARGNRFRTDSRRREARDITIGLGRNHTKSVLSHRYWRTLVQGYRSIARVGLFVVS